MRRVAVIDVGTNTALLLVAEVSSDQTLHVVQSQRRFVRLGEGIDRSGEIGAKATERLVIALKEFKDLIGVVDVVKVVGTSASRDARNIDQVKDSIREETGWEFDVLSGEDEARFSHAGAVSALRPESYEGRSVAVVDIGGGSTEITVSGRGESGPFYRTSMQVGTVRLRERCVTRQPVSLEEQSTIQELVHSTLREAGTPVRDDLLLVGAAGTAITIAVLDRRLEATRQAANPDPILPHFLHNASLRSWRERLCGLTYEEVLALDSQLMFGRADVIPVGAILLEAVAEHLAADGVLVSPYSLRHGIAMSLSNP